MTAVDIFGLAAGPMLTPAERKRLAAKIPGLYAALPGTGPAGETCGSCEHLARKHMSKTYLKCRLTRAHWTGGGGTDVKARSPACQKWTAIVEARKAT